MQQDNPGKIIVLARSPGLGEVSMCGCGVISLHLGSFTLRLKSPALLQMERMLQEALDSLCKIAAQDQQQPISGKHVH